MMEFQAENKEKIKYLLGEATEIEREAVEERMFADEDFFAGLLELENDLTDAFVRGKLSETDTLRFEKSLSKFPERHEKIKNAAALREFIRLENVSPKVSKTETAGFWDKIRAFFTSNPFAAQAVFAGILILLTVCTSFLVYDRYRMNQQLADLKNKREVEQNQKENELQNQLNAIREREVNLQKQLSENQTKLDNSQKQTENLQNEIEREQTEKRRLEKELEDLRRKRPEQIPNPLNNKIAPSNPVFASISLFSAAGGKGLDEVGYLEIGGNISRIRLILKLPPENSAKKFAVRLNEANITSNVKTRNGKTLIVTIPSNNFKIGAENRVTIAGENGENYNYYIVITKEK